MASEPVTTYNIEVRGLAVSANRTLNALARIRGTTKRVIVREALMEYAKKHEIDLRHIAEKQRLGGVVEE